MRIGIDARMYRSSVAGIGRYSQNLIKNLLAIDHDDEFVLFMTKEDYREFKNPKHEIRNPKQIQNYKIKIINIPHYSLAEQTKFAKIIAAEKLDLMHFLNFNYPVRYKGKFMVTIHDLTLLFYPETAQRTNILKQSIFKHVLKKACQNAEKIIAVSRNTKKDIINFFKIPENKITVIYEAADDKKFIRHPEPAEGSPANAGIKQVERSFANAQDDRPIILYVGQFRKHKNIDGLIQAFNILKKELPCKLVLLGKSDGFILGKRDDLQDIIRPGFVSDEELACWYKIASVFVFPSFYEGFGLPGLEAMSAGLPVIASNKGSLPEIYQKAAIYFDPFNPMDIADKIKMVLASKSLQKHLIQEGYKRVKVFSWRKTAKETLELYKQINSKFKVQNSKSKF